MAQNVDVAIIGAGTAGLSAYKEAAKQTESIVIIDHGPLGTTCARVGCMPSKALIHVANEYHQRTHFKKMGIHGAEHLDINLPEVMQHVRSLRDRFTHGVVQYTKSLGKQLLQYPATFITKNTLQVGSTQIRAKKIIIATGTQTIVPEPWQAFANQLLDSDTIFEQTDLPSEMAIIGAGVIGLELGQALSRLGLDIHLFHSRREIAGITDPKVNQVAIEIFQKEFNLTLGERVQLSQNTDGNIRIASPSHHCHANKILTAIGRKPNLKQLNLESLNLDYDANGIPIFDNQTMQIKNTDIYLAGDVNTTRPLLHEAADDGRIAGFNAAKADGINQCFIRRVPIRILFTNPNIGMVGKALAACDPDNTVIGEIDYSDQGRARIMNQNQGILRIYAEKQAGKILGAEFIAPQGEHLAHTLAWAIQSKMTVYDALQMPFYHPVIEEGMRTALRHITQQLTAKHPGFELAICNSEAIENLS